MTLFVELGYCVQGELCPFEHGDDRIVVDQAMDTGSKNEKGNALENFGFIILLISQITWDMSLINLVRCR